MIGGKDGLLYPAPGLGPQTSAHLCREGGVATQTPVPLWNDPSRDDPLEFLQRLATLAPHPRLHLIRFHGVLAPNAALRWAHS